MKRNLSKNISNVLEKEPICGLFLPKKETGEEKLQLKDPVLQQHPETATNQ